MKFYLSLPHGKPSGTSRPPLVIFPVPKCMAGIDIFNNQQHPHTGSLSSKGIKAAR